MTKPKQECVHCETSREVYGVEPSKDLCECVPAAPRAMGASAVTDARITPESLADAIPTTAHIIESHSGKAVLMSYSELQEFARALLAQPEPSREVENVKRAEFEIRAGGWQMAGASGPRETALAEALNYYRQYAFDATEDEPVELVEVIVIMTAPPAAGDSQ
ncbi:hypothetical protein [Cupriavidus necator]